ncbi:hypothetical protein BDZ91DRAFT_768779 [Kalaharituber pfeilii]|nr:hypothetical protein BDZ91DRAFT_768779 [Kalaharituber pfeilii]
MAASEKKNKGRGFVGKYVISPAKHASDSEYNGIDAGQCTLPTKYTGYTSTFASFIQCFCPNFPKNSVFEEHGVFPDWPEVGVGSSPLWTSKGNITGGGRYECLTVKLLS